MLAFRRYGFDPGDAIRQLQGIRTWASTGHKLEFHADADRLFEQFFHDVLVPIKRDTTVPIMVRIDLQLKKIMLLLAANQKQGFIDKTIVERAIHFFPYLRYCYGELAGGITLQRDQEMVDWITDAIGRFVGRTGKPPTGRDLQNLAPKRFTAKNLNEGLSTLEKLGRIRRVSVGSGPEGGRPTTRFVLSELVIDD